MQQVRAREWESEWEAEAHRSLPAKKIKKIKKLKNDNKLIANKNK